MTRYIDAGTARQHLTDRLMESALNNVGIKADADEVFRDIAENRLPVWIDELQTYDVQEVRHGRWIHYAHREPQYDISGVKTWGEEYQCSNCGFIHSVIEDFGHYTYCPNCGSFNGEGGEKNERDVTPNGRMVRIKGTKVLIGMSMPNSCAECKFLCENEGRPFCLANRELITTDLEDTEIYPLRKRSKHCPLVEIADPCSTCFVPLFYNLEDDDSICRDCEVGE